MPRHASTCVCEGCERDGTGELADRDAASLARASGCDDALQARLFLALSDERERRATQREGDGELGALGRGLVAGARRTRQPPTDWAGWGRLILRPTRERLGLSRQTLARKARVGPRIDQRGAQGSIGPAVEGYVDQRGIQNPVLRVISHASALSSPWWTSHPPFVIGRGPAQVSATLT